MRKNFTLCFVSLALISTTACTVINNPPASNTSPKPSANSSNATSSPSPATSNQPVSSPSPTTSNQPASPTPTASSGTLISFAESEPNNDFDKANRVNANFFVNGKIGESDDVDFYNIAIPAGNQDGVLKITINENNQSWTPHLTLFTSSKTEVDNTYAPDATSTPYSWNQPVTAGKSYYLKLDQAPGDITTYKLSAEFIPVADAFEPNNTFDDAKDLTIGQTVDLYMFSGYDTNGGSNSDVDYFKINVLSGKKIKIFVKNNSTAAQPQNYHVSIYDSSKTLIDEHYGDNNQADLTRLVDVSGKAGTYYLKFDGVSNSPIASKLTVTLE